MPWAAAAGSCQGSQCSEQPHLTPGLQTPLPAQRPIRSEAHSPTPPTELPEQPARSRSALAERREDIMNRARLEPPGWVDKKIGHWTAREESGTGSNCQIRHLHRQLFHSASSRAWVSWSGTQEPTSSSMPCPPCHHKPQTPAIGQGLIR